jgi:outer membrane protein assembly factor BamB
MTGKPLRVWPGLIAAVAVLVTRFGVKAFVPGFTGFSRGMMWSFWAAGAVLLWWLLLSRARWFERLGGVALIAAGLFAAWQLRHASMSLLWLVGYAVPFACLALVAGAVLARRMDGATRRATIAGAVLLACFGWTLLRTEGISGDHFLVYHWRWSPSPEERLLAQSGREPAPPSATVPPAAVDASPAPVTGSSAASSAAAAPSPQPTPPAAAGVSKNATNAPRVAPAPTLAAPVPPAAAAAEWPGFRGPERDGIVHGLRIATDWSASPPVELWRRAVGPGWSSVAVSGGRLYTQEQRGDDEVVACYDAATGAPVWRHRDRARFFESNGGPGPRGTPTLDGGRVYTLGATGLLNALDARHGRVVWSREAAADAAGTPSMGGGGTVRVPDWGFSSSPLVVGDLVIVAMAGQLVAYDLATGKPRWVGPRGGVSYSSPQLVTIGGVPQVVLASGAGLTSVAPADGKPLWKHEWKGFPIVQPAIVPDGLLVAVASDSGTRRLAIARGAADWTVEPRWTSPALKPYFNDFVVHDGHAYGFDGRILACIDLSDGQRKWKGGRYGNGQLVLLAEQELLLVLSEDGELALVKAAPDQFTELARIPALQGKTWNHPALARGVLLVRNGEEMVAYRLPPADPVARLSLDEELRLRQELP